MKKSDLDSLPKSLLGGLSDPSQKVVRIHGAESKDNRVNVSKVQDGKAKDALSKEVKAEEALQSELQALGRSKFFLGYEFLTWLWYLIEKDNQLSLIPKYSKEPVQLTLWIDDRVVTSSTSGQQNTMRGGDPAHSAEAAVALVTGKTIRELKIGMDVLGVGEYRATLNAKDLRPRGLVLPIPSDEDEEGPSSVSVPMRLRQLDLFLNLFDSLFLMFMEQRTAVKWEKNTTYDIKEWIQNRSNWKTVH
jgi:hypothetical protein